MSLDLEKLTRESEYFMQRSQGLSSNFWIGLAKEPSPSQGITRLLLLLSDGEGVPWKRGSDNYWRHPYEAFTDTGERVWKNILCGTPWGVKCPVCDLMKVLSALGGGESDRVAGLKAKESIISLVLDMDEVERKKEVSVRDDGTEEWVHALELKTSLMPTITQYLLEGSLLTDFRGQSTILKIMGTYPPQNKRSTKYTVGLEMKGPQVTIVILEPWLIEIVEQRLDGNNLINSLIRPFNSPLEVFRGLSEDDQRLLKESDYMEEGKVPAPVAGVVQGAKHTFPEQRISPTPATITVPEVIVPKVGVMPEQSVVGRPRSFKRY